MAPYNLKVCCCYYLFGDIYFNLIPNGKGRTIGTLNSQGVVPYLDDQYCLFPDHRTAVFKKKTLINNLLCNPVCKWHGA